MPRIDILTAEHHRKACFFGTEVMRTPSNASVNASVLYGFNNGRRILEFYDGDILAPIDTFFFKAATNNGVGSSQSDRRDFFALEVAQLLDGTGIFLTSNNGLVATHDTANNANVSTLRNVDERSERAKGTGVKLTCANSGNAVTGIREFHQGHVKSVLLENASIFRNVEFSMSRRRKITDRKLICGNCR